MRASPVRRIIGPPKICYDCDREQYPNGKILFDDEFAKQDRKGRWHCSDCQLTDRRRTLLKMYGPNHKKTRDFFQKEERNIRAWNQAAKKLSTGPHRMNKYTGRMPF
jgi:hypothetical protein